MSTVPAFVTHHWMGSSLLCLAIISGSWAMFTAPGALVAQQAAETTTAWEYNVVIVDPAAMQTQLTGLGNDRWEVISIVPTESKVDPSNNQMVQLRVERFQVTSRRAKK